MNCTRGIQVFYGVAIALIVLFILWALYSAGNISNRDSNTQDKGANLNQDCIQQCHKAYDKCDEQTKDCVLDRRDCIKRCNL